MTMAMTITDEGKAVMVPYTSRMPLRFGQVVFGRCPWYAEGTIFPLWRGVTNA